MAHITLFTMNLTALTLLTSVRRLTTAADELNLRTHRNHLDKERLLSVLFAYLLKSRDFSMIHYSLQPKRFFYLVRLDVADSVQAVTGKKFSVAGVASVDIFVMYPALFNRNQHLYLSKTP